MNSVRQAERMIKPDAAWVKADRAALLTRVRETLPASAPSFCARMRAIIQPLVPSYLVQILRGPTFAILSVLVVALGGSIASVSASEQSMPGDWLYPIKIATEQTRLVLTSDKADKLRLKTDFVGRRLEEMKGVAASTNEKKLERLKEAAGVLRRDLDTVKQQLTGVKESSSSKDASEAAKYLDQKSTAIAAELGQMKQSLTDDEKDSVSEAQFAAVNTGVKAMEVLIENKDQPGSQGVVTDQELTDSIATKVASLEANIAETSEKINFDVASSTSGVASTTQAGSLAAETQPATATSTILFANMTLLEAKALLENNQLDQIPDKLLAALQAMNDVDKATQAADKVTQASLITDPITIGTTTSSSTTQPISDSPQGTTVTTSTQSPQQDSAAQVSEPPQ